MRTLAKVPGQAVDTVIGLAWLAAWRMYQLAEWIERFEPQATEQFTKSQLTLIPGEYRQ